MFLIARRKSINQTLRLLQQNISPLSDLQPFPKKWVIRITSSTRNFSINIRNIGILAHIDAGKTTTTEHILYLTGKTKHIGRVDNGDTVMDYLPQEKERGITISAAAISCHWKDHQINIIDTPGHIDFSMEVEVATKVIDGCVLILDAVAGVQCQTKTVWKKISSRNIPAIAFINKMDRDGADFHYAISTISQQLFIPTLPLHYPLYETNVIGANKPKFLGCIDLISQQTILWDVEKEQIGKGKIKNEFPDPVITPITAETHADYWSILTEKRQELIESVADYDEFFMNYYFESLSDSVVVKEKDFNQELFFALQRIIKQRKIIPVICGSAIKGKGIHSLLDSIICFLPNPIEIPPRRMINIKDATKSIIFPQLDNQKKSSPQATPSSPEKTLLGQVFKVIHDPNKGMMAFIRLFSGQIITKQTVYNTTKQKEERIYQLLEIASNEFHPIPSVSIGEIGCIIGCRFTRIGDTIIEGSNQRLAGYRLEGMVIPKPVYSLTIEPEHSTDQADLEKILKTILTVEDPSLLMENDLETGEMILYGLGELHLEIVCDKIFRQYNIPIRKGKASIHYRESIQPLVKKKEFIWSYDRIIDEKRLFARVIFEFTSNLDSSDDNDEEENNEEKEDKRQKKSKNQSKKQQEDQKAEGEEEKEEQEQSLTSDEHAVATFHISSSVKDKLTKDEYITVIDTLNGCISRGPRGYPVIGMNIRIKDIEKVAGVTTTGAIRACIATGINHFLKDAEHQQLLEPMMNVEIDIPNDYLGDVIADLTSKRRAMDVEMRPIPDSSHTVIEAIVPLQTLLGYITILRSMTRGEGIFSSEYVHHAPVDLCYVKD